MRLSLAVLLLLLTGCHDDPPDSMTSAILAALTFADMLAAQRGKAGTRFSYYAKKRIQWLVGENINLGLPPFTTLMTRIGNEIDTLTTYLEAKLGTLAAPGPLGGPTDSATPPHTDLADVAQRLVQDEDPDTITTRRDESITARRNRVQGIVWRAAAIHHELWQGDDTSPTATLDSHSLDLLLDRRLRIVERMLFTDDAQSDVATWTVATGSSGWDDNNRTIMFEYPFVAATDSFRAAVTAAGLDINTLNADFTVGEDELTYHYDGHLNAQAALHFTPSNNAYTWSLSPAPGTTPAQAFDVLIPDTSPVDPSFRDFWNRNWMFCDPMIATLHIDNLRFGLARADGSDDAFNATAAHGAFLAVPIHGGDKPDPTVIMTDGAKYYDGVLVKPGELQIGDHVIFWNSYFVRAILRNVYGLENSLITKTASEDPRHSSLAGHGVSQLAYAKFADDMLDIVTKRFKRARAKVVESWTADNTVEYFSMSHGQYHIIRWDPYDTVDYSAADGDQMQADGAWWIRLILADIKDEHGNAISLARGLQLFPRAVNIRPDNTPPPTCPGHASDYQESIYLPLSVPNNIPNGWTAYFDAHKNGTNTADSILLDDIKVDATWVLGFFYNGPNSTIPVVRPKAVLT